MSMPIYANEIHDINVKEFSLKADRSRIIINDSGRGALLTLENNHEYPMLVQTRILDEHKNRKSEAFIATPPLFRLNEGQKSKVRIYKKNADGLPKDRETLFWTCTKGIPPTEKDVWAKENENSIKANKTVLGINLAVENCIKLFHRPKGVPSVDFEGGKEIVWSRKNGKLRANNPTPNYINFEMLFINGLEVKSPEFIPPFSEKIYDINTSAKANIEWRVITDFGGIGRKHNAKVN